MRSDIPAPSDRTIVNRSGITVTLYDEGEPRDLIVGTTGLDTRDLTSFVESCSQTAHGINLRLAYRNEFSGVNEPALGRPVQLASNGFPLFNGIIDSVTDNTETRGERGLSLSVRSRDYTPWWREVRRIGPVAAAGVDLAAIARGIGASLGLTPDEIDIQNTGITLAHGEAHLADMNAFAMLERVLQPALLEPYVDGRGVLKAVNRNVQREPDLVLTQREVLETQKGRNHAPLTTVRVKWLDPALTEVEQQPQVLAEGSIVVGFFKPVTEQEHYWSQDRKLRAKNVRLSVKEDFGIYPVATLFDHTWSEFLIGEIGAKVRASVDIISLLGLIGGAAVAGGIAAGVHLIEAGAPAPDPVTTTPVVGGGTTIRVGSLATDLAILALTQIALTMNSATFEIIGVPFDFVHVVNEVEAYDQHAEEWMQKIDEIESDLIPNSSVADNVAVNELLYRAREAKYAGSMIIADDLRIELGDLIEIYDGRKFYVQDFSRNTSRGAEPVLSLTGFWT